MSYIWNQSYAFNSNDMIWKVCIFDQIDEIVSNPAYL